MALLPAAESFRFGAFTLDGPGSDSPRTFSHLTFCAIAILRLAAALILRRLRGAGSGVAAIPVELPLRIARSSAIWESIRSFWAVNPSIAAYTSSSFNFIVFLSSSFTHVDTVLWGFLRLSDNSIYIGFRGS